jgi:Tol biopolymer transport system component
MLLIPPMGGPTRKLTQIRFVRAGVASSLGRLSWSRDGLWIVTSDREEAGRPPAIFLVSVETGEKRKLTSPGQEFDFDPAFSADGKAIAFCRYGGNPIARIFVLNLSADSNPKRAPRPLTPVAGEPATSPTWTADGREVVYTTPKGLYRVSISGGPPAPVLPGVDGANPAISRHGHRMVFQRPSYDTNTWRVHIGQAPQRLLLRPNTTRIRILARREKDRISKWPLRDHRDMGV